MKKRLLYAISIFLIVIGINSCEDLGGCKFCKTVTYENNQVLSESGETEYCGADLLKREATPDVKVGSLTTKVECR